MTAARSVLEPIVEDAIPVKDEHANGGNALLQLCIGCTQQYSFFFERRRDPSWTSALFDQVLDIDHADGLSFLSDH